MAGLGLQVEIKMSDKVEQDISCDSKFMIGIMNELGNVTQSTYFSIGVVDKEIIYLLIDNVGVHRKNGAVLENSEYLSAKNKISVHHQVPW